MTGTETENETVFATTHRILFVKVVQVVLHLVLGWHQGTVIHMFLVMGRLLIETETGVAETIVDVTMTGTGGREIETRTTDVTEAGTIILVIEVVTVAGKETETGMMVVQVSQTS